MNRISFLPRTQSDFFQKRSLWVFFWGLSVVLTLIFTAQNTFAQKTLLPLNGTWKFQIGDEMEWASESFNDSPWRTISVPGAWEDQGLPGYDGYAWYRITFDASTEWFNRALFLELGRIDDVDEVYLNGELLGKTGTFPPHYQTAYQHYRKYYLPHYKLHTDKPNTIAIRVFDERLQGGILEGNIAISGKDEPVPVIDLAGFWQFKTGDNISWSSPSTDISNWTPLMVPMDWDQQGFAHYDGYAWYALKFELSGFDDSDGLFLSLGKIDDMDQVYLNGILIGQTGFMPDGNTVYQSKGEHQMQRNYKLPQGLLKTDGVNYLAVRVFDGEYVGGIYQGPIGVFGKTSLKSVEKIDEEWSLFNTLFELLGWN